MRKIKNICLIILIVFVLSLLPNVAYASSDFDELTSILSESETQLNTTVKSSNTNKGTNNNNNVNINVTNKNNVNTNVNTNKNANVDKNLPTTGLNDHPIAIFVIAISAIFIYSLVRITYYKQLLG